MKRRIKVTSPNVIKNPPKYIGNLFSSIRRPNEAPDQPTTIQPLLPLLIFVQQLLEQSVHIPRAKQQVLSKGSNRGNTASSSVLRGGSKRSNRGNRTDSTVAEGVAKKQRQQS